MANNHDDAKLNEGSSTSSVPAAPENGASTETAQSPAASFGEATKAVLERYTQTADDAGSAGPTGAKTEGENTEHPQGQKTEGEGEGQQPAAAAATEELPPFHEHPRWKEVTQQRDELKAKADGYEQELASLRPLAEAQRGTNDWANAHGIGVEEFQNHMNILALSKTDPAKALEMLRPLWQQLSEFDPNVLPRDLQERVAAGLDETVAREIAALRAEKNADTRRQQSSEQVRVRQAQQAVTTAIRGWAQQQAKQDPDFKPKAKAEDPDSLFELTQQKFGQLLQANPIATPAEAKALADRAYRETKVLFGNGGKLAKPQPAPTRTMPSNRSVTTNPRTPRPEGETTRQAALRVAASVGQRHGIALPADEE